MLGLLISNKEKEEIIYILKREMDELLYDLREGRLNSSVKKAMEERYQILFHLLIRLVPPNECAAYVRNRPRKDVMK
ncbi:hypothetical protein [Fervidibacillus halotolerans]|uniref:Uncharacterized protein n=1 Tax=Fervidibacillus halotolerans TaxID=2980027 RepID=A0A9E8LZ90_9BACI|nr:hypothetical protein [Fervidibacillus halotolerans]WAA12445.1 hypothetical protein OE105_13030 [Fervidibacillus halotolerans]